VSIGKLPACLFFLVAAAVIAESPRLSIAKSKNAIKAAPGVDKHPMWHVYMLSPPQTFCCFFCFFWSRVSLLAAFLCSLTHHLSAPLVRGNGEPCQRWQNQAFLEKERNTLVNGKKI